MPDRKLINDPFGFARRQDVASGQLPLSGFERLADVLADDEGGITYHLCGQLQPEAGRDFFLLLRLEGLLNLVCQRCLKPYAWPVDLNVRLKLYRSGQQIPDDEMATDDHDVLVAGAQLDVLTVVEDELLLAMPFIPKHTVCPDMVSAS